jgi:hypothetical protein
LHIGVTTAKRGCRQASDVDRNPGGEK